MRLMNLLMYRDSNQGISSDTKIITLFKLNLNYTYLAKSFEVNNRVVLSSLLKYPIILKLTTPLAAITCHKTLIIIQLKTAQINNLTT